MRRFLPAILLSLSVTATAPVIGSLRHLIFDNFPRAAVPFLAVVFSTVALVLLIVAVRRIRSHRWLRYGSLVLLVCLLWIQIFGFRREMIQVEVVEKVHIFEYGLLAYLLYRAFRPVGDVRILILPMLWVSVAGTLEEGVQWWFASRIGEIRDVWLNLFAGLCGLLFSLAFAPPESFTWRLDGAARRRVLRTSALAVLLLGVFFICVHLGYLVDDPEIGHFRSRYTGEQLLQLSQRRAAEWAVEAPTGIENWQKEDYFLSEAGFHASHRNASWEIGDYPSAWRANRILEKYYGPFLDLRSFRSGVPHRYPQQQRLALERRVPNREPGGYLSPVLAGRIFPWPRKPHFLGALAIVVLGLWGASHIGQRPARD